MIVNYPLIPDLVERTLVAGEDFTCKPSSMRSRVQDACDRRGYWVRVRIRGKNVHYTVSPVPMGRRFH